MMTEETMFSFLHPVVCPSQHINHHNRTDRQEDETEKAWLLLNERLTSGYCDNLTSQSGSDASGGRAVCGTVATATTPTYSAQARVTTAKTLWLMSDNKHT